MKSAFCWQESIAANNSSFTSPFNALTQGNLFLHQLTSIATCQTRCQHSHSCHFFTFPFFPLNMWVKTCPHCYLTSTCDLYAFQTKLVDCERVLLTSLFNITWNCIAFTTGITLLQQQFIVSFIGDYRQCLTESGHLRTTTCFYPTPSHSPPPTFPLGLPYPLSICSFISEHILSTAHLHPYSFLYTVILSSMLITVDFSYRTLFSQCSC